MSTTFSVTAGEVITEALEDLSVVGEGRSPNSDQYSRGIQAVNFILKMWSPGVDFFVRATQSANLTSGTGSYTLGPAGDVAMPRPKKIVGVVLRDSDGNDMPLKILTKDEYESLTDKDAAGIPAYCYPDYSSLSVVTFYLYPVIDADSYSVRIDYRRPLNDVTAITDSIDLQQEWYAALISAVTARLAKKFGKKSDLQEAKMLELEAKGVTRQLPQNPLIGWPGEYD